ncbi:MAG TPA: hypothetical protein VLT63_00035, partial [Candidatus Acidoferrum sp.]|nr:hypothetical protein [Candidatus Acidoferrum sp.]
NMLLGIIRREGTISKVNLIMKSGLSISYYNNLKPFLEEIYPHLVQYDRTTKLWRHKANVEPTNLETLVEMND